MPSFQLFPDFIEQQLQLFDAANNPSDTNRKPVLELKKASLEVIDQQYYWISGQVDVYRLNNADSFAFKMSELEIGELPVELVYTGESNPEFLVEERRAFQIILQIILKMNLMQSDSKFHGFLLGKWFFN